MIAQRRTDVDDLNTRARERLRAAGLLGEHELRLPGGHFAAGDHVVVKVNDLRRGVINGDRGRVTAVDPEGGRLVLECGGEQILLDVGFLHGRTAHGDPTLLHGDAIATHVSQGLTVDHAYVLAGDGINRESAHTALSRGRHSNRLYRAGDSGGPRQEFAPTDPSRADPLARLAAALERSSARPLAIDAGQAGSDRALAERLAEATAAHADAISLRRSLEARRTRWLPGRLEQLEALRDSEAVAARRVQALRRKQGELRHGARPFVTERELDASVAKTADRVTERRLQRAQNRDLGRGLGR